MISQALDIFQKAVFTLILRAIIIACICCEHVLGVVSACDSAVPGFPLRHRSMHNCMIKMK